MNPKISVIIPVYRRRYLTLAVKSALQQPQTAEVLLVEDHSPDHTLEVCQLLAKKYEKVKLLRHPNGENRGTAASRNLGIRYASCEYIAFLDDDDYYLPGRFFEAEKVFEEDSTCDGVYEAIGIQFESDGAREIWDRSPMRGVRITSVTRNVSPENLFETLVSGEFGWFHLNGLVIRKSAIEKVGFLNDSIRLHDDTDFIHRLAAVCKLRPSFSDKPVAIRRVHKDNQISAPRPMRQIYKNRVFLWMATYRWLRDKKLSDKSAILFDHLVSKTMIIKHYNNSFDRYFPVSLVTRFRLLCTTLEYPELILQPGYLLKFLPKKIVHRLSFLNRNIKNSKLH